MKLKYILASFVLCIQIAAAQGVAVGQRIDMTAKVGLSSSSGQFAQLYIPDYFQAPGDGKFTLVFHFHSASWAAEDQVYRSNTNAVLFNIHIGALSSPYSNYFTDQSKYAMIQDSVLAILNRKSIIQNPKIERLIITSFSAGYAGVREILKKDSYFNQIDAINLADGLHASDYYPSLVQQMEDFLKFAKKARDQEKVMLLTHSSITTSGYQSTMQTADYLINGLNAARVNKNAVDEIGTQYSACDTGYFHLKGYLGNTASDHLKHLYAMHLMLEKAVQILDSATTPLIDDKSGENIKGFHLKQNYPNPFNDQTTFCFTIPIYSPVHLDVYDVTGQLVENVANGTFSPGTHWITWNAHSLASGIYFVRMHTKTYHADKKLILFK